MVNCDPRRWHRPSLLQFLLRLETEGDRARTVAPEGRCHLGGDREGNRLAESFHPRIHQRHHTKKMGLAVESAKNDSGERTYRITA
jgi:hypothetical protein